MKDGVGSYASSMNTEEPEEELFRDCEPSDGISGNKAGSGAKIIAPGTKISGKGLLNFFWCEWLQDREPGYK